MKVNLLQKKNVGMPPVNHSEVLRYAGVKGEGEVQELLGKIDEFDRMTAPVLKNTVIYRICPVSVSADVCNLGFVSVKSRNLAGVLAEAKYAVLMAATLGFEADRLIYKYSRSCLSDAHILDALLTERIEALCNSFSDGLEASLSDLRLVSGFRFSPGYGDFPIRFQREVFSALSPEKHIGLTLNDSCMMSPSKSVTAIIPLRSKT